MVTITVQYSFSLAKHISIRNFFYYASTLNIFDSITAIKLGNK